jgi:hypothetical protein
VSYLIQRQPDDTLAIIVRNAVADTIQLSCWSVKRYVESLLEFRSWPPAEHS